MAKAVQHTVQINSSITKSCQHCGNIGLSSEPDVAEQINHYLKHGYKVLHVGQETSRDANGDQWQSTVAILGK
jgi:hypothetical protein